MTQFFSSCKRSKPVRNFCVHVSHSSFYVRFFLSLPLLSFYSFHIILRILLLLLLHFDLYISYKRCVRDILYLCKKKRCAQCKDNVGFLFAVFSIYNTMKSLLYVFLFVAMISNSNIVYVNSKSQRIGASTTKNYESINIRKLCMISHKWRVEADKHPYKKRKK